jgi:gas vesicle protein
MNRDDPRTFDTVDRTAAIGRDIAADAGDDETQVIRANIEQTRAEMSETIDAIQERLSPSHLKEQAQEQFQDIKDQVREQVREQFHEAKQIVRDATIGRVENMVQQASDTVNDTRYTIGDTIRQNPIPAALVGIGLGWLFMNRSSNKPVRYSGRGGVRGSQAYDDRGGYGYTSRTYDNGVRYDDRRYYDDARYYDQRGAGSPGMIQQGRETVGNVASSVTGTASNVASNVADTASNVASNVTETASNLANRAQETASNVVDQAQYQAQRVEDRFQQSLHSNPLAVGAIAIALGTAVGLALPQTERENQLMGEARDNLIDKAQEVASDTMEKVQRVATDVADETKQTVKEQAREHGLSS